MSYLNYISNFEQVQIVFLLSACVCFIGWAINRRMQKAQDYDHEEKKEQRRERFMALEVKPKTRIINDNEDY